MPIFLCWCRPTDAPDALFLACGSGTVKGTSLASQFAHLPGLIRDVLSPAGSAADTSTAAKKRKAACDDPPQAEEDGKSYKEARSMLETKYTDK